MNKQTEINFSKMSKADTTELTTIVRETIAMDIIPFKNFTATDLWNIQRRKNTMRNRRHLA